MMSDNLQDGERSVRGRWLFSGEYVKIVVSNGVVESVTRCDDDPELPYISFGFLDMQVNGYRGLDYSAQALTPFHVARLTHMLEVSGTTEHVPTVITSSKERIIANLRSIADAVENTEGLSQRIPAIHVEGPFISPEDGPRGAHDREFIRDPDYQEFLEWKEAARGLLQIVTVAPETPGALEFIERVSADGIIVSVGHTAADPGVIREAVAAGARMSTHLGNGSHGMLPRLANYLWEQLSQDALVAGMIADGFHLPGSVIKVIMRAKGLSRLLLVSDVGPMGGLNPGVHKWGNINVEVHPDGHLGLPGTEFLAGAGHLLDRDVVLFAAAAGVSIDQAVRLCSVNPRGFLHGDFPDAEISGALPAVGDRANLVVFQYDRTTPALKVLETVAAGAEHVSEKAGK